VPNAVADELAHHVIANTHRLINRPVAAGEQIGVAVSGGADSMALLALAHQSWPGQIMAATVDHGLRQEAAQECAMVSAYCLSKSIPHHAITLSLATGGNLMARAREARYSALNDWANRVGLDWLMTAHQADDLFETMLMRLNRGAGIAGLAAIRLRRGRWLRPLLSVRRADLRTFCEVNALPFVDDPSNIDERFDRARLREALGGALPVGPDGLQRSAAAMAEADDALEWMVEQLAQAHLVQGEGTIRLTRTDLPPALLRRLLARMIDYVRPGALSVRGPRMDQAVVQLSRANRIVLADCLIDGGAQWVARPIPPRRAAVRVQRPGVDEAPLSKASSALS
jgi:tRNA(Ile)-lysidine synthase